jgi:DnaJ-class molecular chaperone
VGGEKNSTSTLYELLSLRPNNTNMKEIKKAYRSMALRYHPDVCPPPMKEESTRIFVQLHAAYTTLSDPVLRREYDSQLGLGNFGKPLKMDSTNDHVTTSRWQEQILELKRRSGCRMAEKEGSWGSRIRAQNMRKKEYYYVFFLKRIHVFFICLTCVTSIINYIHVKLIILT